MKYEIKHGDCLEVLRGMADSSIDAIVTDPPYGLSFMGKKWDYDVPSKEIWAECLRVLKPGGHLLSFAGTRTQHRMAVRIEDAGFEIRDMICWCYGSGFPKSLDVSKAIDKRGGSVAGFEQFRDAVRAAMKRNGVSRSHLQAALGNYMLAHYLTAGSQPAVPNLRDYRIIRDTVQLGPEFDALFNDEAEREVVGQGLSGKTAIWQNGGRGDFDITAPATDAARQWQGWGTALKPALEPITVARKPIAGTVAENVLEHGTGALNVDGCRVGEREKEKYTDAKRVSAFGGDAQDYVNPRVYPRASKPPPPGRWPANLIHDGSDEVVGLFPETGASKSSKRGADKNGLVYGKYNLNDTIRGHNDNGGSAARFFYCAKASKADRDEGCEGMPVRDCTSKQNNSDQCFDSRVDGGSTGERPPEPKAHNHHPTVKPTALMRYLCRLVTPPGGTVLDPFTGSGSTGKAAMLEGFNFIGIEREAEYVEIASARIEKAQEEMKGMLI